MVPYSISTSFFAVFSVDIFPFQYEIISQRSQHINWVYLLGTLVQLYTGKSHIFEFEISIHMNELVQDTSTSTICMYHNQTKLSDISVGY